MFRPVTGAHKDAMQPALILNFHFSKKWILLSDSHLSLSQLNLLINMMYMQSADLLQSFMLLSLQMGVDSLGKLLHRLVQFFQGVYIYQILQVPEDFLRYILRNLLIKR